MVPALVQGFFLSYAEVNKSFSLCRRSAELPLWFARGLTFIIYIIHWCTQKNNPFLYCNCTFSILYRVSMKWTYSMSLRQADSADQLQFSVIPAKPAVPFQHGRIRACNSEAAKPSADEHLYLLHDKRHGTRMHHAVLQMIRMIVKTSKFGFRRSSHHSAWKRRLL